MYCHCYRHNPDSDIRQARRDFQAQGSYEALDRWAAATMRAGYIPVELMIPVIRKLEAQAQDIVYEQLRQDPTYQKKPAQFVGRWEHSVEVSHPSQWNHQPRRTRVTFDSHGESHFHLSPCGRCNLPSWQQPCPWCGFYPMGRADYAKQPQTREDFLRTLQGSTGLAKLRYPSFFYFYAQQRASNCIPEWAPIAQRIRDEMVRLNNQYQWPTHEEVWDYHVAGGFGQSFPFPPPIAIPEYPTEEGPAYRRNPDSALRAAERAVQMNPDDVNAWSLLLGHASRVGQAVYVDAFLRRTLKPGRGPIPGALGDDILATARVVGLRDFVGPVLDVVCVDVYFNGLKTTLRLGQINRVGLGTP